MKIDRSFWPTKLRLVKRAWLALQPDETAVGQRVTTEDFIFRSTWTIAPGRKADSSLQGWGIDDEYWSVRVRLTLFDERVSALMSTAMNFDSHRSFLSFDLLAASSVLDGQPLPESPYILFSASDQEVIRILDDYSQRCERIWRSVGGRSADNFEALAIWLLHNRHAVGSDLHDMGVICAAFVYGERQLG